MTEEEVQEIEQIKARIADLEMAVEFILTPAEPVTEADPLESRHVAFAEMVRMDRKGRTSMLKR